MRRDYCFGINFSKLATVFGALAHIIRPSQCLRKIMETSKIMGGAKAIHFAEQRPDTSCFR